MFLLEPATWDWATLGKTAVGAGFGTALVQGLISLIREWTQAKRKSTYLASRLAVTLEFFAMACADFIQDNKNAETGPDQEFPEWSLQLPELPAYPDDADGWMAIDVRLAERCLNLRNKIHCSQKLIETTIDLGLYDDLEDTLEAEAAGRGAEAWALAKTLRSKHGIVAADMQWDYADTLKATLRAVEKRIKECKAALMP